jgi:DNA polymerase-3 subunit epsilon
MSQPLSETEFCAIDFESAGAVRGATDVPVQVGMAVMRGREILTDSFFRSYLRAGQPVTWQAQRVHGIRTEDLAGAPPIMELWPVFRDRLGGRIAVAHGSGTERRFLRAFPMHGFGPWVDTVLLARRIANAGETVSLGAVVERLGLQSELDALCPGGRYHDALVDAVASLLVLRAVIDSGKGWSFGARVLTGLK